ncbi:MAG: hypothetical protein JW734_10000 [Candidatus Omnitrophica bacterium]|nr:hypothetical protein [Candidatus Omnitrophota bacterium]
MRINKIAFFVLFLVCTGLNLHLRLFPVYFPQLKEKAKINVEHAILDEISGEVNEKFPDYNPLIKTKIIKELFKESKKDKAGFKEKVIQEYRSLKDKYQDKAGQTYLLEFDPYSWMRFTRFVLKNGYPGNEIRDGIVYDTYMLAPGGEEIYSIRFLYYSSAFLYKCASFFSPSLSLERFLFYLPVLFSLVFFISLYLFCRYFFSEVTAIFSLIFVGLAPIFIARSSAGWFDNDVLNILFPLLSIWALARAFGSRTPLKNILFSLTASFFISLYAFTWPGWWFIYLMILAFFGYVILNNLSLYFKDWTSLKKKTYPCVLSLLIFLSASVGFCLLVAKIEPLSYAYTSLRENLGLGKSLLSSVWPNTYYTVQELQPGSFLDIPPMLGGWAVFIMAVLSSLWIYIRNRRTEKLSVVVLLVFWLFSMTFASLKGSRFTLLLSVPIGIFLGAGLDRGIMLVIARIIDTKDLRLKIVFFTCVSLILYAFAASSINRGFATAKASFPAMNDDWHNFLIRLKESTPEDSIINSWWDYGSWFKEVSRRPVIFDGLSQNRPLAHWMARVLLTEDEEEAFRILKMLNNSSEKLFEDIEDFLGDGFKSVTLLNRLFKTQPKDTDAILDEYGLSQVLKERIKEVLFLKTPGPAYLVLDESMIYKMQAISFLGNWSFPKAYVMKHRNASKGEVLNNLSRIFALSSQEAERIYNEVILSQSPSEVNEVLSQRWAFDHRISKGKEAEGLVYFTNGAVFDLEKITARIFHPGEREFKKLKYIYFFSAEDLIYKEYEDSDFEWACLFLKKQAPLEEAIQESDLSGDKQEPSFRNEYVCLGLAKELANTLFCRLYFMKAKGLKHFEPFVIDEEAGLYAFKINWEE